jgi:hypothetical protein
MKAPEPNSNLSQIIYFNILISQSTQSKVESEVGIRLQPETRIAHN